MRERARVLVPTRERVFERVLLPTIGRVFEIVLLPARGRVFERECLHPREGGCLIERPCILERTGV